MVKNLGVRTVARRLKLFWERVKIFSNWPDLHQGNSELDTQNNIQILRATARNFLINKL